MTFRRLAAIALIFMGTSLAWTVLGSSLIARTGQYDDRLEQEVQRLWGAPHRQAAPDAWAVRPAVEVEIVETKEADGRVVRKEVSKPTFGSAPAALESTRADATLDLEHRRNVFGGAAGRRTWEGSHASHS